MSVPRTREVIRDSGGDITMSEDNEIEIREFDTELIEKLEMIELLSSELDIDIKLLV